MIKSNETEYPKIVYKYRSWSNIFDRSPLLNNTLFLSSPSTFNDPFDCRIYPNYHLLDDLHKRQKYAEFHVNMNPGFSSFSETEKELKVKEIIERLTNPDSLATLQKDSDILTFDRQNKHYGVLCLSSRWDSSTMWAHYGDNQQGYCIGFHEKALRESGNFGKGGVVLYDDIFPQIMPPTNLDNDFIRNSFSETHTKALDWKYESEYRLTRLFAQYIPTDEDRTIVFQNEDVAEIIIGLNTEAEDRSQIIDISKRKGFKIYQIEQVPFSFKLNKTLI